MGGEKTRKPAVAGMFYSGSGEQLQRDIKKYLSQAKVPEVKGKFFTFYTPHAGYVYSAPTAAYTYKLLQQTSDINTVIIVGLSHRYPIKKASFYDGDDYETPLGNVKIDQEIVKQLRKSDLFESVNAAHAQEHSVEVQVPFLQEINDDINIVTILVSQGSYDYLKQLGKYLGNLVRDKNIPILISTDMSHYHSKKKANTMDRETLDIIERLDSESLYEKINKGECELCGGAGTVVGMIAAQEQGADTSLVLNYSDSATASGDTSRVVGYFSAVIYKSQSSGEKKGYEMLTGAEKQQLLNIARNSMESAVKGEKSGTYDIPKDSILYKKRGAFVTLTKNDQLRGCIGYIKAVKPLHETISEMAVAASLRDTRFSPVTPSELDSIDIEISVLSELKQIDDVNEIEVGTHGIIIQKGYYSGLLLPQVATEYNWTRDEFLSHTCRKAGLPMDSWKKEELDIFIFSANIFHEE